MFRRYIYLAGGLVISTLVVAGCGNPRAVAQKQSWSADKDGVHIQLQASPDPLVARKEISLEVHFSSDSNSQPAVDPNQVQVVGSMPDMFMPSEKAVLHRVNPSTFQGQTLFTMGGPWVIQVTADLPHSVLNVSFPVHVKE